MKSVCHQSYCGWGSVAMVRTCLGLHCYGEDMSGTPVAIVKTCLGLRCYCEDMETLLLWLGLVCSGKDIFAQKQISL